MSKKANLILLFTFFCAQFIAVAAPSLFYVKIENNTEPYLGLWIEKVRGENLVYNRIPLNKGDEISFELDVPFEQVMQFEYGKIRFPVLIKPGEQPKIYFSSFDLYNTLTFKGLSANENNFMAEYKREYGAKSSVKYDLAHLSFSVARTISNQASTHTDKQFFFHRNADKEAIMSFLAANENQVDDKVFQQYKNKAIYDDLVNRITYFIVNKDRMGLIDLLKLKEAYPLPIGDYSDDSLLDFPAYQNYLKARLQYEYLPGDFGSAKHTAPIAYNLAQTNFTRKASWYLKSEILCVYINKTGAPAFGQERFPEFYKNNPYQEYTGKVNFVYGSDLNAITSTPAPLLEGITADGRKVALQDYQGRIVYISFWASWCKPCLKNFKNNEGKRKELQDIGVVLYNVSIDDKKEAFLASLERQDILGMNVLAIDTDKTKIEYNLTSIPAYYIIDKNGKFTFLSDDTSRDIVDEFKEMVRE
jgi:thiol-disulfide isomerase/thioredoxin